jgi:hypothetical protein
MFPASVEDVEIALQEDRRSWNILVDSASWTMLEQLLALDARKKAMLCYTNDLFLGAQEAYSAL